MSLSLFQQEPCASVGIRGLYFLRLFTSFVFTLFICLYLHLHPTLYTCFNTSAKVCSES